MSGSTIVGGINPHHHDAAIEKNLKLSQGILVHLFSSLYVIFCPLTSIPQMVVTGPIKSRTALTRHPKFGICIFPENTRLPRSVAKGGLHTQMA